MFLLNSCLGLFSAASPRRRPFSRSYGAILPSSLAMLLPPALGSSPCPPVSVCGTGAHGAIAAFLGTGCACFPTWLSVRVAARPPHGGFSSHAASPLAPVSSLPAHAPPMRPRSSGHAQYRNVHLSSIGYALRPRLRPRLTQGRSALPWKPRTSGLGDSRPHLATHSGILSSQPSTAPYGAASPGWQCSPTKEAAHRPLFPGLRRRVSAPDIFGAGPLG